MREEYDYTALVPLRAPGTMVFGYRAGDGVPASVVESWDLVVGEQVSPTSTGVIARPEDDDRRHWEAYAIGQGWTADAARAASLDDLQGIEQTEGADPEPLPDPNAPLPRPEPSALKSDWIAYVLQEGADPNWANDKATTKADLQDYSPQRDTGPTETVNTPPVGDTVAVAATEANQG